MYERIMPRPGLRLIPETIRKMAARLMSATVINDEVDIFLFSDGW
jgi:hypothetical protein